MSSRAATKTDQKEYLRKYLSGDKEKKKKKKSKKHKSDAKVRIIDDDISTTNSGPLIDEELLQTGEDAPQIVGEYIEDGDGKIASKWRSIAVKEELHDQGFNGASKPESDDMWGRKAAGERKIKDEFSPPRRTTGSDRRHNDDLSPPRRHRKESSSQRRSPSPQRRDQKRRYSSDQSPPRRRRRSSDQSPPRRQRSDSDRSSPRRPRRDSDRSPPRRKRRDSDHSPPRRTRRDSDQSPPRKPKFNPFKKQSPVKIGGFTDSRDLSPPRKRWDPSPPRQNSYNRQDSRDQSPPRKNPHNPFRSQPSLEKSPQTSWQGQTQQPFRPTTISDSDQFRGQRNVNRDQSQNRRHKDSNQSNGGRRRNDSRGNSSSLSRHESLPSPSRRSRFDSSDNKYQARRQDSPPQRTRDNSSPRRSRNSGLTPPRKQWHSPPRRQDRDFTDRSPPGIKREKRSPLMEDSPRRNPDLATVAPPRKTRWGQVKREVSLSPPPTHKPKAEKTLDGKTAGLQNAQSLKHETEERRRQEERMYAQMAGDVSGRDAEVQVRSTGRRGKRARDAAEEDPEEQRRKEAHEKKKQELYARWGKGVKQVEEHRARRAEQEHESQKPLARYAGDEDLERHLKDVERIDDPMLEYMRQKRKDHEKKSNKPTMPIYHGPYPENRFSIRPGYRWDGVDRSNGYEQKYFRMKSAKVALQEEAYKYSVEDM